MAIKYASTLMLLLQILNAGAFVTPNTSTRLNNMPFVTNVQTQQKQLPQSTTRLNMMDSTSPIMDAITSTSMHIATIDADIANIADDQFGLVFAGGIVVMFGGVLSALAVGAILNAGQSYGRVIADSYVEDGSNAVGDDPFASMTDEERAKAEELLDKLRASKKGAKIPENFTLGKKETAPAEPAVAVAAVASSEPVKEQKTEKVSMFDDYE